MRGKRGFTLVELIVVIAVLAVLSTLIAFGVTRTLANTRDEQRTASSTALVEKLEAYYMDKGEYPSIPAIAADKGATASTVASLLKIDSAMLQMPQSNSPLSIVSPQSESDDADTIVYDASSTVNSTACTDSPAGGCDLYTLRYFNEDGSKVELHSRHDNTFFATIAIAPLKPEVSVGQNGTLVEGEASNPRCDANAERLVPKYRFRYQINTQAWVWGPWQASNTFNIPGNGIEGASYSMQVMSRCDDATTAGAESPVSDIDTYIFPVGAPAPPTTTVALNGNTKVQATSSVVTCPAGTTTQYAWRTRTNGGTWSAYSAFSTTRTSTEVAPVAGSKYGYTFQARCFNTTTSTAGGAASSVEASYTYPITAPATPAVTVALVSGKVQATVAAATCQSGTVAQYSWRTRTNTGTWGAYSAFSTTLTATAVTPAMGVKYGYTFQARCYNTTNSVASSAVVSSEVTYTHPITAPTTPTTTVALVSAKVQATVSAVTCPSGTTAQYAWRTRTNGGTWGAYSSFTTTRTSTAITPAAGVKYGYNFQARCYNTASAVTSSVVTTGEASYTHPIPTPATPTLTLAISGSTITATSSATTCPSGTSAQYQFSRASSTTNTAGTYTAYASLSASRTYSLTGTLGGTKYWFRGQTRCTGANNSSAFSAASAAVAIVNPSKAPASYSVSTSTGAYLKATANATCASPTTAYYAWTANGSAWVEGTGYKTVTYNLSYNQTVKLAVKTRCQTTVSTSAYTAGSTSPSYTRPGMNLTLTAGADECAGGFCGRLVSSKWTNVCGTSSATMSATQNGVNIGSWTSDSATTDTIHFKGNASPGRATTVKANIGCTSESKVINVISIYH